MSQDITSRPIEIQAPDAQVTHAPYDVHSRLEGPSIILGAALGLWETRDDSKAQPQVRQAANRAMDTIDAMLRDLHAMRSRLVSEIRVSDDATAARVDATLARMREEIMISHEILGLTFDAGYAAARSTPGQRPVNSHLRAVE